MAGATRSLEYNIPEGPEFPDDFVRPEERHTDIFDFLQYVFGFQVCIFFLSFKPLHLMSRTGRVWL